jgi:hypothetical protein
LKVPLAWMFWMSVPITLLCTRRSLLAMAPTKVGSSSVPVMSARADGAGQVHEVHRREAPERFGRSAIADLRLQAAAAQRSSTVPPRGRPERSACTPPRTVPPSRPPSLNTARACSADGSRSATSERFIGREVSTRPERVSPRTCTAAWPDGAPV